MTDDAPPGLADDLLRVDDVAQDPAAPGRRWTGWMRAVLTSAVFAYLGCGLLIHNLPARGLLRDFYLGAQRHLQFNRWMRLWVGSQRWAMFAPDPYVANTYMGVIAIDDAGQSWDLGHDSHGRRQYPYLFYDRMGKVNRRLIERSSYRRPYAAWVCREWARTHDGEPPAKVTFVHKWARLVPPKRSQQLGGFDPDRLNMGRKAVDTFVCEGLELGQLSPQLRERYGFTGPGRVPYKPLESRSWAAKAKRRAGPAPSETVERPEPAGSGDEEGGW